MPNPPYTTDDDTIRCYACCSLWGSPHAEWCEYYDRSKVMSDEHGEIGVFNVNNGEAEGDTDASIMAHHRDVVAKGSSTGELEVFSCEALSLWMEHHDALANKLAESERKLKELREAVLAFSDWFRDNGMGSIEAPIDHIQRALTLAQQEQDDERVCTERH